MSEYTLRVSMNVIIASPPVSGDIYKKFCSHVAMFIWQCTYLSQTLQEGCLVLMNINNLCKFSRRFLSIEIESVKTTPIYNESTEVLRKK